MPNGMYGGVKGRRKSALFDCIQTKDKPPISRRSVVDDQGFELGILFFDESL